jgi:hypothetical protein
MAHVELMNVAAVKLACWTASIGITFALSGFVYDFYKHGDERTARADEARVLEVLNQGPPIEESQIDRMDRDLVRRAMEQLNWTGQPPAEVVAAPANDEPVAPPVEPVDKILSIVMIQVSRWQPAESRIYARNLKAVPPAVVEILLKTGESLPTPYEYIQVKEIRPDGVDFAFADTERPIETLHPATDETLIVEVGPGGPRTIPRDAIPQTSEGPFRPQQTTETRKHHYKVGIEDAAYLQENYAKVLTNDLRYRTWVDPKTGRRAGIEIQEVREGSLASRHGAQTGDVILSVNGHAVSSDQEAIQYFKANKDKYSSWEVEVLRMGRTITMHFESPSE